MNLKLKIGLGQMDVHLGQPERNLTKVKEIAVQARDKGVQLLILPELWSTGYDLENSNKHATTLDKGVFASIASIARDNNLAIFGSCLSLTDQTRFANTGAFFDRSGRLIADYGKIHLFRLMDEHNYLTPGERPVTVETEWGRVGLAICYDLRFPELFRQYALQGAQLILIPAEWPYPRLTHWRTLLQARAIENQYFVAACNRVGMSKGSTFFGHSTIIDPRGEILIEGGEEEALLTADIDLATVDEARKKIPIFEDRRPDLYGSRGENNGLF